MNGRIGGSACHLRGTQPQSSNRPIANATRSTQSTVKNLFDQVWWSNRYLDRFSPGNLHHGPRLGYMMTGTIWVTWIFLFAHHILCVTDAFSSAPFTTSTGGPARLWKSLTSRRHAGGGLICVAQHNVNRQQGTPVTQISSLSNPVVKRMVRLREHARFRREEGCALVAGWHPIQELCSHGQANNLKSLILLDEDGDEWHRHVIHSIKCTQGPPSVYSASPPIMKKISGLDSPEHRIVLAEFRLPQPVTHGILR